MGTKGENGESYYEAETDRTSACGYGTKTEALRS